MNDFIQAVTGSDVPFTRNALVVGLLASVAFGVMGSYVTARRISYVAGSIAHSALGGIGAGLFLKQVWGWGWMSPMLGAATAALVSAVLIGLVSLRAREREDTVIGAVWAVGMAAGLLFLAKTPGYIDLAGYLTGDILIVTGWDILIVAALDVLIVGTAFWFYHIFSAVCFDEEYARLRGIPVEFFYLLLLCLTALTIVLLVKLTGVILVIALLTLPAAIAARFARRLWTMMVLATALCALFVFFGLALSYQTDSPAGATMVLLAGAAYLVVTGLSAVFPKSG